MKQRANITFDALVGAGRALVFAGLVGSVIGLVTGMACGVFFFVAGAAFGAIWGLPTGFCAGILAAATGNSRRAWRISGALCGVLGGYWLVAATFLDPNVPFTFTVLSQVGGYSWLVVAIAGVGGFIAGGRVAARLEKSSNGDELYGRLATTLRRSSLSQIGTPTRLLLAAIEMAPVLALGWRLSRLARITWWSIV